VDWGNAYHKETHIVKHNGENEKNYNDESLLKNSTAGRYTEVFSKPTVYNIVTFNTAIFF